MYADTDGGDESMSSCKCKNTDGVVMDKNGNTAFMNILGSITRYDIKNYNEK